LTFAIDTFIPFAALISEGYSREEATKPEELALTIHNQLIVKCKNKWVIIFIDNYQWIDGFSREILERLVELSCDEKNGLMLIINSDKSPDKTVQVAWQELNLITHQMEEYDLKFITELLQSLNINHDTAEHLYTHFDGEGPGIVGSIFMALSLALDNGKLIYDEESQSWIIDEDDIKSFIDLDSKLANKIGDVFKDSEIKAVLSCAACFGNNFRVSWLMNALKQSRLEVISILDEISQSHGIVKDVLNKDDWYGFRSNSIFNVVQKVAGLDSSQSQESSQLVKELHGLAGTAMEQNITSISEIFEIADHYIFAGFEYKSKAFKYACKAVSGSMKILKYKMADKYLAKARTLKSTKEEVSKFHEIEIVKACDESHLTRNKNTIITNALEYLKENKVNDANFLLIIARTCFEERLNDDCIVICQKVIKDNP